MKNLNVAWLTIFFLSIQAYMLSNVFPAVLAFSIALYIFYLSLEFDPKIEVRKEIDRVLYEGRRTICRLRVKNLTGKDYNVEFFDELPPDFEVEKLNFILGSYEEKEIECSIIPVKGVYKFYGTLKVTDSRGFFSRYFRLEGVELEVIPSVEKLKEEAKMGLNLKFHSRSLFGTEFDFQSLREFQSGDDARRIDWKVSARLGELIVKEFLKEWEGDVYLALDTSREMRKKLDHALKLVFQLLNSIKGKKIGLIIYDEIGIRKTVKASEDVLNIVRELKISPTKAGQSIKIPEIRISRNFIKFLRKLPTLSLSLIKNIPKKAAVIFITDLSNPDELLTALSEIRKGCRVLILALNPILFYRGEINRESILRLYEAYVKREKVIRKMNRIVPTFDLGPGDSILEMGGYFK